MRVTEKGQVTIPKHIRDRLGIKPGSEVEFLLNGERAILKTSNSEKDKDQQSADDLIERLRSMRGCIDLDGMSVDEYMKFLRD